MQGTEAFASVYQNKFSILSVGLGWVGSHWHTLAN